MTETATSILFGAALLYVALGNYLYFGKILPALGEEPKLSPSGQLRDVDRYVALLKGRSQRPWFLVLLRHVRGISVAYLIGFGTVLIFAVVG